MLVNSLRWAHVHGHCYGTLKSEVDRLISAGQSVVLEIDVQGWTYGPQTISQRHSRLY